LCVLLYIGIQTETNATGVRLQGHPWLGLHELLPIMNYVLKKRSKETSTTWIRLLDCESVGFGSIHQSRRRRRHVAVVRAEDPVEEHGQPHPALRDPARHDRQPRVKVVVCREIQNGLFSQQLSDV
jgi:hypothetical protein